VASRFARRLVKLPRDIRDGYRDGRQTDGPL